MKHLTLSVRRPSFCLETYTCESCTDTAPAALVFHGGGFVVGTRLMISPHHIADLVAEGFVVASADYSLCPQVSLYDGPQQDAKDAYRWCKQELPSLLAADPEGVQIDADKIVAVGYSAGANLALCLVSTAPHCRNVTQHAS